MEPEGMYGALQEAEYLVRRAQEYGMTGDHTSAIDYLKKAIEKYPRYAEAYTALGNCQECQDKLDDAITSYNKALQIDPTSADAWFNKGTTLQKKGQIEEARLCIAKSIDLYVGR